MWGRYRTMPDITLKQIKEICDNYPICDSKRTTCPLRRDKDAKCVFEIGGPTYWDIEEIEKRIKGE